jgi:hypothetical protein
MYMHESYMISSILLQLQLIRDNGKTYILRLPECKAPNGYESLKSHRLRQLPERSRRPVGHDGWAP